MYSKPTVYLPKLFTGVDDLYVVIMLHVVPQDLLVSVGKK